MSEGTWRDRFVRRLSRRAALAVGGAGVFGTNAPRPIAALSARCSGQQRRCGDRCRDVRRDRRHCGSCGRRCGPGEQCRAGVCRPSGPNGPGAAPRRPFPYRAGYAPGTNFPSRSEAKLADDVRAYYDIWKARYVIRVAPGRYRIAFSRHQPERRTTVSEGQGYGMIITALMAGHDPAAQRIFDGLWRYVRDHPSAIEPRLMDWRQPRAEGNVSAFDGDADIAYGLLLAAAQWGTAGAIDYQAAFAEVAAGIVAATIGRESNLPTLGDWVNQDGQPHNQWTPRSSDFMPAHFRAFAAAGVSRFADVIAAGDAVISAFQDEFTSGLLPDFIVPGTVAGRWAPAPSNFLEAPTDGDYYYNAGRVPWRLGTDAVVNGAAAATAQVRQISRWAATAHNGRPERVTPGYRLAGSPLYPTWATTSFFIAPLGVAAMATPGQQAWLDAIHNFVRDRHEDYYPDSVTLLCLLIMAGVYWAP